MNEKGKYRNCVLMTGELLLVYFIDFYSLSANDHRMDLQFSTVHCCVHTVHRAFPSHSSTI